MFKSKAYLPDYKAMYDDLKLLIIRFMDKEMGKHPLIDSLWGITLCERFRILVEQIEREHKEFQDRQKIEKVVLEVLDRERKQNAAG